MATSPSSSAQQARRVLGSRLDEIRKRSGLSGSALAARCGWNKSKVSRIANAVTPPSEADIRAWATHCGAEDEIPDLIASLRTVEGMWVEWRRQTQGGLRAIQASFVSLYEKTTHMRTYSCWLLPGPVQIRPYAESIMRTVQQRDGLIDDVEAATDARLERQRYLYEGNHTYAFLIEESVLRCTVVDNDTMAAQLGHLLTIGSLPNVSLGIIPMTTNRTHWPCESFGIFDDHLVNVELVSTEVTIRQPREIALYDQRFKLLSPQAKRGTEARKLITKAVDALG
ncbi:MAG: helix-turn-helix domain-containing protein [Streptomyces sp.]|nr:helix-turn-helix domain-containing protein [Streptomyces sp.]